MYVSGNIIFTLSPQHHNGSVPQVKQVKGYFLGNTGNLLVTFTESHLPEYIGQ